MNYIIDPMWFYWIGVVDTIRTTFVIIMIVGVITAAVFGTIAVCVASDVKDYLDCKCFCEDDMKELLAYGKYFRITIAIVIVLIVAFIFLPSKNTLVEMQIAKYATYENAELTLDGIKSAVDYVVYSIQSLK